MPLVARSKFIRDILFHPLLLLAVLYWIFQKKLFRRTQRKQIKFEEPSENKRKKEFCAKFPNYGYNGKIDSLRESEFRRLKTQGLTYLDHAGATLYSESQIKACQDALCSNVFANPHSRGSSSRLTTDLIEQTREIVLKYFGTSSADYSVIFTAGATGACKLLGEVFPWSSSQGVQSEFCYFLDNHNSVLGIRESARDRGARFSTVDLALQCCCPPDSKEWQETKSTEESNPFHLFAFPAESNFSGVQYNLNLIKKAQEGHIGHSKKGQWKVLVDASKFVTSSFFDLSKYPADFVCLSFYKLFGYPTGLGALIVRNDAIKFFEKRYFGGGTVEASLSSHAWQRYRKGLSGKFEDGTVSFISINELRFGFKILNELGIENISKHVKSLTLYLQEQMKSLRHYNGTLVCELYYSETIRNDDARALASGQGGIVCGNFLRPNGEYVGYGEVDNLAANVANIQIRTGCFCNPGACEYWLNLSSDEVKANLEAGHVCWDDHDIMNGKPTGSVRLSFGYMTTFEDIEAWLTFVQKYFVISTPPPTYQTQITKEIDYQPTSYQGIVLKRILVYPIKSCGAMNVQSWPIGPRGFLYDREWSVVDPKGVAYTQKTLPAMTQIRPWIDIKSQTLRIDAPEMETLILPLNPADSLINSDLQVCGFECSGKIYSSAVARWFTKFLGRPCNLARAPELENSSKSDEKKKVPKEKESVSAKTGDDKARARSSDVAFANDGQFLLVSEASVDDVLSQAEQKDVEISGDRVSRADRFRPNFVIGSQGVGLKPFEEDNWTHLQIGPCKFQVVGSCMRCTMVNIDQETGKQSKSVFGTLATVRREKGKIRFGILLSSSDSPTEMELSVGLGMPVIPRQEVTH